MALIAALTFEATAHAAGTGDTAGKADKLDAALGALRSQIAELQAEVKTLKAEQRASQSRPNTHGEAAATAAAPAASTMATASANAAPAAAQPTPLASETTTLANDDVRQMREQINNLSLKTDALEDAATHGPIAGLSVTGYIDPVYLYNRARGAGSFQFLNHNAGVYDYYESTIGDVYLDIKKTFGVGPLAPAAELVIEPNRGAGNGLTNERGGVGNNIVTQADATVPLNSLTTLVAGLVPSPIGYEFQPSNQMVTLTHNLLFDFSEPGSILGVGVKGNNATMTRFWQVFVANEQLHTAGTVASGPNNTSHSNWLPSLVVRYDSVPSTALDIGVAGMVGRSTLLSPCTSGYGYQCNSSSPFGMMRYIETDLTYTRDKLQLNAQLDYGEQQKGAWNGGTARWYGLSLQGHRKWTSAWLGHMGATLRFDYLDNSANGGGAPNIAYGLSGSVPSVNPTSGFGLDPACWRASTTNGTECKGARRYDLTADLLFYPTDQITVKLEYRHDQANHPVFLMKDGSYSRSNDLLAAQFLYSF